MGTITIRNRNQNKLDKNEKLKKANWEYRFEGALVNGKRNQISKSGFRTKAEAQEAGTAALAEYNRSGLRFEPSEISISDFFDYWTENYCHVQISDNTTAAYETVIRLYIKPKLGKYKLKSIDTLALQTFVNEIYLEHHFKKSYLNTIVKVLKGGFSYAVKTAKFISNNPAADIKLPDINEEQEEIIVLSQDEISQILNRFKKTPHQYYAILIAYYTGMRISEVYGLTWDCIDFAKNEITVNKIIKKFGYDTRHLPRGIHGKAETRWYLGACKTLSSYRIVKFGEALSSALKEYKAWQESNKIYYGDFYTHCYAKAERTHNNRSVTEVVQRMQNPDNLPELNLVCVSENGQFHGTDSMKYPSKIINNELGIRFNFHALRHTHATRLIETGVPVKAVSDRLGHSSSRITLDVYVKVTDKMKSDAVDAFESNYSIK